MLELPYSVQVCAISGPARLEIRDGVALLPEPKKISFSGSFLADFLRENRGFSGPKKSKRIMKVLVLSKWCCKFPVVSEKT